jgi:hypothetical protein
VQAVATKGEMRRLLPDDSARSLVIASGLGAASSSCSYASVALAAAVSQGRRFQDGEALSRPRTSKRVHQQTLAHRAKLGRWRGGIAGR